MEVFYSEEIGPEGCYLGPEESVHLAKVLRHRPGDEINVIDGRGTLYTCRLADISPKGSTAVVISSEKGWGSHPYTLTMAVCPTKNIDRFEWFAGKAVEIGVDRIVPLVAEHSERRVLNEDRLRRILVSACKQSYKAMIPELAKPMSIKEFLSSEMVGGDSLKAIAYCFEGEEKRRSFAELLRGYRGSSYVVMIGPEGDFTMDEASEAIAAGFVPVTLGNSRLRTETAALTAVEGVYFKYM
jgi:16S rRNA (uracil1498-N3)-methyltransferase